MNNYIVYMHISPSNKRYIGITCLKPERRWRNGKGYINNKHFTNAINKYGWDNFQHIVIAKGLSKEEACWLEIELIRELDTMNPNKGYNITKGGEGTRGVNSWERMEEDARQERSKKTSGENHHMYGKHHTEESKRKMSEALSGENNPMYGIDRHGEKAPNYGKPLSEETKKKISERMKGKYEGENNPMYGKKHTDKWKKENGGKNHPQAKSIICLTTKRIFLTIDDGANYYNCNNSCVVRCCKGRYKTAGKLPDGTPLVWRYLVWNHNKILRKIEK